MPTTTGYDFGDVVLVPFPFTDQSTTKKRPAVVVSSAAYHRERHDLIILAITSQSRITRFAGEATIQKWEQAGLLRPSVLKPVVATIDSSLVARRLGRLADQDRLVLRGVLDVILGT